MAILSTPIPTANPVYLLDIDAAAPDEREDGSCRIREFQSKPLPLHTGQPFPAAFETGDVHLGARLGEREVTRSEFGSRLCAEQSLCHVVQRSFEIAHGDIFADNHHLNLVEGRRMGGVRRVTPVASARNEHLIRQRQFQFRAHLCRRGVRSQYLSFTSEPLI